MGLGTQGDKPPQGPQYTIYMWVTELAHQLTLLHKVSNTLVNLIQSSYNLPPTHHPLPPTPHPPPPPHTHTHTEITPKLSPHPPFHGASHPRTLSTLLLKIEDNCHDNNQSSYPSSSYLVVTLQMVVESNSFSDCDTHTITTGLTWK